MDIDGLRDRDHVLAFIAADHASAGERSAGLGLRLGGVGRWDWKVVSLYGSFCNHRDGKVML